MHVVAERGPRGLVELLMDAGCSKEAEDVHGRKPADAAESAGQAKIAEIIRGYKDPVLKVGGSVGISKRMEFLETGQLELDGVGADRGGGGSLRASAKKLRKDLFAKLKGKKKYKAGMTKPKKPPVLPEIRFPSDAETYKPWVRYVSEAGEPYWSLSRVFIGASTLSMRPRLAAKLPPTAPSPRGYPTVTPSPRRVLTRRRHRRHNPETDASTWDEPPKYIPAPKGEARVTSAEKRARAQAKKAKRQAHRRRLAAAPTVGDEPALMDAPSPIATTPEARSRQLRALKRADSARRAATPAAGSRGATPQQFSPTNAVGMGALFAPGGDVTPVRRSSARSSRASSTPGEDLPPEAARFVAQVMSPEQSRPSVEFFHHVDAIDAALQRRPPLPPIVADPAAEARKKRALRKARKAAAAVARLNKRRAEKFGKEPASRKGTAASGRANFSRNLSRKLALNLSKLPAPAARVSEQPLKRVTWSAAPGSRRPMEPSRESSAGLGPPPGSRPGSKVRFEVRAWTPSGGSR